MGHSLRVKDIPADAATRYPAAIIDTWHRATPDERQRGAEWYADAREHAGRLGIILGYAGPEAIERGAAIIAVLSPQLEWSRNVAEAYAVVWAHRDGQQLPRVTAYPANVAKARAILAGGRPADVVSGPKVSSFYRAIVGAPTGPVVDRHATRVATGHEYAAVTKGAYRTVQEAYETAADILGVDPHTLQAATWLVCKRDLAGSR